jgi:sigma-E factor negative regulatory protein RseC
MDSKKEVAHTGIIKSIDPKGITVSIVVQSGCASCHIKGNCSMAEQTEKELYIEGNSFSFHVGQRVLVRLKTVQGMQALFLGYMLPFFVLITVMVIASQITTNEGTVGLVSLGSMLPYYFVLYLFKNRLKKKFTYVVDPLNN